MECALCNLYLNVMCMAWCDVEWSADVVERFDVNYGAIKCGVMSVYVKCGQTW